MFEHHQRIFTPNLPVGLHYCISEAWVDVEQILNSNAASLEELLVEFEVDDIDYLMDGDYEAKSVIVFVTIEAEVVNISYPITAFVIYEGHFVYKITNRTTIGNHIVDYSYSMSGKNSSSYNQFLLDRVDIVGEGVGNV